MNVGSAVRHASRCGEKTINNLNCVIIELEKIQLYPASAPSYTALGDQILILKEIRLRLRGALQAQISDLFDLLHSDFS